MYHQEGRRIAAGGEDGSLHLIDMDRPHANHEVVREAHKVNSCFGMRIVLLCVRSLLFVVFPVSHLICVYFGLA